MFEVVITYNDERRETYDGLTEIQATCIFFRARMNSTVDKVEINEFVDMDNFA